MKKISVFERPSPNNYLDIAGLRKDGKLVERNIRVATGMRSIVSFRA